MGGLFHYRPTLPIIFIWPIFERQFQLIMESRPMDIESSDEGRIVGAYSHYATVAPKCSRSLGLADVASKRLTVVGNNCRLARNSRGTPQWTGLFL